MLLNDTFADNERLTQAPPASAHWFYGAHHDTPGSEFTSLDASGGALFWDHTNSSNSASFSGTWAHFAPSGSPVTVGVDEVIRLTFDVTFTGGNFATGNNAFRWSLLDSNGSRVADDFAGQNATGLSSGTTFGGWRGYEALLPLSATDPAGTNFRIRERVNSGPGLNTSSEWANLGAAVNEPTFADGVTYQGLLEITRTATGVTVRGELAGASTVTAVDDASAFTTFDTASFFILNSNSKDVTLDNVRVEITAVPEPGTVGLGLAGLGLMLARRRAR
ncbi:MAG: PEP-CTERM sorting domain-containing protein [Phycisphaerae bacterium]